MTQALSAKRDPNILLRDGERIDDLQFGGFRLIQNPSLFSFSTDAVLLAEFAKIAPGAKVVDLGAGNGILEVLLYSRQKNATYGAVEIQPELFDLLERNIALNGMAGASCAILGDIRSAPQFFGTHNDAVVCNPPFEKADSGFSRTGAVHEAARRETRITFGEICKAADGCLRWGGKLYIVHRTDRLAEILCTLRDNRLEPKLLRMCAGSPRKEPRTCLIMAKKGAKEGMRVLPQLTLLEEDGSESAELKRIYRKG